MSNLTIGKIVNNIVTLILSTHANEANLVTYGSIVVAGVSYQIHTKFSVNVPNYLGFTHKTRCLCHVESVSGTVEIENPVEIVVASGVKIGGVTPQRVFRNGKDTQDVGAVYLSDNQFAEQQVTRANYVAADAFGPARYVENAVVLPQREAIFTSPGDVINNGLLCSTPFGKRLEVELYELNSRQSLCPEGATFFGVGNCRQTPLANNPITIKMRLLFLDEDDLKDY